MKPGIKISLIFFLLFSFAQTASAKSYSIDKVQIRAWIQTDGNVLINEKFTYTFDGTFESLRRSIHQKNHDGVKWFEAYELVNDEAELGFLEDGDLKQLKVERREGNTYRSPYQVENDTKNIVYAYELKNAVKSYETYSDLTIPFFGTDGNHDVDLNDVTVDFVFPEKVDPADYSAFYHGREGEVEEKGSTVIRFTSSVSKMYSLTETRLLFPSSIMKDQKKTSAPASLESVITAEEKRKEEAVIKEEQTQKFNKVLEGLAVGAGSIGAIVIMGMFIGRIRGRKDMSDVLDADPLLLYMVHNRGKFSHLALMAGLFSLVERGKASARTEKTSSRFLSDPKAPDETLFVHLTAGEDTLSDHEKNFVSRFFKRKGRNGSASLALTDLAGATKEEKDNKRHTKTYHSKVKTLRMNEREWFSEVLKEAKEAGLLHGKWFHVTTKGLPAVTLAAIVLAYYFDQQSPLAIFLCALAGIVCLVFAWVKSEKKWPLIIYHALSFIEAAQVYHETTMLFLILNIILSAWIVLMVPRHTLSGPALGLKAGIRRFKKQARSEGIPAAGDEELDKWMIRSMLFQNKRRIRKNWDRTDRTMLAAAPLASLVLTGQNPHEFLVNSWKWSVAPPSASSGYTDGGGDSGGVQVRLDNDYKGDTKMKLVLIFGPQAVGKMTVGQELEKATGLKLFHNHMTIELLQPFFGFTDEMWRLSTMMREEIFEAFAKSDQEGMIFTFMWAFNEQEDWDWVEKVEAIFESKGAEVYFVELESDLEVRLERNKTENRLQHKPSKRNIEDSEKRLLASLERMRLNSNDGEIDKEHYLKINNTTLSPEETAKRIIEEFKLT
jgi:Predicted membrane protein (DUF2207)/AAA domain